MGLPRFDLDIYELPIDNIDQYQVDVSEDTELLVIFSRDTSDTAKALLQGILDAT